MCKYTPSTSDTDFNMILWTDIQMFVRDAVKAPKKFETLAQTRKGVYPDPNFLKNIIWDIREAIELQNISMSQSKEIIYFQSFFC